MIKQIVVGLSCTVVGGVVGGIILFVIIELHLRPALLTPAVPAENSGGRLPASVSVKPDARTVTSTDGFAFVFDPPSNVRVAPSAASGILCAVTTKTAIRILGTEGNWYKTDIFGGESGYIHRSQVKF